MAETLNTPILLKTPIADKATSDNIMDLPLEYNEETDYGIGGQDIGFPTECRLPIRYSDGTPGKGRPPKMQIMNMMMKTISSHNFYAQNGGTYTFSQAVSDAINGYPAGTILWYKPTSGVPYLVQSLIDNNTNNFVLNPALIDGVHWKKINATAEELDNCVKLTGNQSIGGEKTFSNSSVFLQYPYNIILKSNLIDITEETPDINKYVGIEFRDKNNVRLAWIGVAHKTNGISRLEIQNQNINTSPILSANPPANSNDTSIATTSWVRSNVGGGIPVGTILPYGGATAPAGFLLCNGGAISRTTYANLFSVIGTAYGAGDGNTTFNLPNTTDRYLRGNDRGYSNQTLPDVVGAVTNMATAQGGYNEGGATPSGTGAFVASKTSGTYNKEDGNHYSHGNGKFDFKASRSNGTYGAANKNGQTGYVMPHTTHCFFIIKY